MLVVTSVALGACDSGSASSSAGAEFGGGTGPFSSCSQFASCDLCTPVTGCGWCYNSDGTGACTPGPGECTSSTFTWTWKPDGCRVTADASAVQPYDAGANAIDTGPNVETGSGEIDAGSIADAGNPSDAAVCRWPAGADTYQLSDGGKSGCHPSTGGNLCPSSSDYTLSCYGGAEGGALSTPSASLGCAIVTLPTPTNLEFYCCPCAQ
jgi:hypothetical protein